ncbi:MAG TPA: putative lipid II flippase FtsW [Xanthomonadales bacterium]|nr:putative lipid II flippase FtsW [Xanthomonadales bacterium]
MILGLPAGLQALRRDELPGRFDAGIALAALALAAFGLVMVASSSIAVADGAGVSPFHYLGRHVVFLGGGLAFALVLMLVPLAALQAQSRLLLLVAFLLLLAVFVPGLGRRVNGATRWLNFGITGFQAVEAVKLLLIVYLASYLVRFQTQVRSSLIGIMKPLGLVALLVVALLAQPDFGSAALLIAIVIGMVWLAGARLRDLGGLALLGMPVMAIAALAEPYRVKRLTSFLDPWADPFNDGFQLSQALIAIGRGEWLGVGLGASIQKLYYLPEAHTDFILAVIAEELGLAGVIVVLVLFAVLVGRALGLGLRAVEKGMPFAGYCAFGIGLWIGVQALVSIGVNLGVLPTKGLTLPLISSGGSSLLATCAALGVLLRVSYEVTRREAELALEPVAEDAR